jgi:hypothetical protein
MHKEPSNIDGLFHSGLRDYSPLKPSKSVWRMVSWRLFLHKAKRRVAFLLLIFLLPSGLATALFFYLPGNTPARGGKMVSFKGPERSEPLRAPDNNVAVADKQVPVNFRTTAHTRYTNVAAENSNVHVSETQTMQTESGSQNLPVAVLNTNISDTVSDIASGTHENNSQTTTSFVSDESSVSTVYTDANITGNMISDSVIETKNIPADSMINPGITKEQDSRKFPFSLEFYAGPAYTRNGISAISNDYGNIREQQEKALWTYCTGLEISYTYHNFFVQTGVGILNFGEKANYNWQRISGIDTSNSYGETVIITYPDPEDPDNTIIAFDSVWVHLEDTSSESFVHKGNNTYSFCVIPVLLGYRHSFGRVDMRISAGISLGFLAGAKGMAPSENLTSFLPLDRSNTPIKKTICNAVVRLGISYSLNRYTSIFAEPEFTFTPSQVFRGDSPLSVKYYNANLHIGINYHF